MKKLIVTVLLMAMMASPAFAVDGETPATAAETVATSGTSTAATAGISTKVLIFSGVAAAAVIGGVATATSDGGSSSPSAHGHGHGH